MSTSCEAMRKETLFEEMKRYVRFTDADLRLLADLREVAAPEFPRIAAEFYERIREHEEAHSVFHGEEQIERLQRSLVAWMDRVCSGVRDEAYFKETAKIGRIHVRIGLAQRYMLTAMALIRVSLARIADARCGAKAPATREAIMRALDVELAIMLETYRDDFISRIRNLDQAEREKQGPPPSYRKAVELANVVIVGLDASASVRVFNAEAERITGFARDEVMGLELADVLRLECVDVDPIETFRDAAAGKPMTRSTMEVVMHTRAQVLRDLRFQLAYAGASEQQDGVALFVFGRDVTHDNRLAARLRQNEKLAAVGTLAAGLAHEIRNPLNGAQLHITFLDRGLKRSGGDAESIDAVRVVQEEISRLSALVTEFLEFARPQPLDRRQAAVRPLCERVMSLVRPQADQAHVALAEQLPLHDIEMLMDPLKMEQVLLNLVRNAIEACAPGQGGSVLLRVRRQPRDVVFEVEDDGPGLPRADAPIFDPFFSTKPGGTGLGLAIVHRIVTDHGGSIDVDRKRDKTMFRVVLPIDVHEMDPDSMR